MQQGGVKLTEPLTCTLSTTVSKLPSQKKVGTTSVLEYGTGSMWLFFDELREQLAWAVSVHSLGCKICSAPIYEQHQ